jgi:DNA-binding NtrC family response regulator
LEDGVKIERQDSFKTAARMNAAASRHYISGDSDAAHALRQMTALSASCDMPLLICGPYGSGKEHVARYIHAESGRRYRPFLKLNCGLENLAPKIGSDNAQIASDYGENIETADGGTLFLSNADEMSIDVQTLILQLIEQRNLPATNSGNCQPLNIRVIASSSRCLASMVSEGTFRQDLYYRLNMLTLPVPPLRQRREDIALLMEQFLLEREARERFNIDWPADQAKHIAQLRAVGPMDAGFNLKSHLEAEELQFLTTALRQTNGVVQHAANLSGLKRTTFIEKMRKHGIERRQFKR